MFGYKLNFCILFLSITTIFYQNCCYRLSMTLASLNFKKCVFIFFSKKNFSKCHIVCIRIVFWFVVYWLFLIAIICQIFAVFMIEHPEKVPFCSDLKRIFYSISQHNKCDAFILHRWWITWKILEYRTFSINLINISISFFENFVGGKAYRQLFFLENIGEMVFQKNIS